MNVQERIERIEALEAECYERFKALKAEVQREEEFPQMGKGYWCIEDFTDVSRFIWDGNDFDNDLLTVGNVFRTEKQAVFALEKLKVEAELRKFSRGYIEGRNNWYILYDFERKKVMRTNELHHCHQGVIYFADTYTTQQAIESVGAERIKKYIFGVED